MKKVKNINTLQAIELEELSEQIGGKIRDIVDKAVSDTNKILNKYNMSTKMQIVIEPLNKQEVK